LLITRSSEPCCRTERSDGREFTARTFSSTPSKTSSVSSWPRLRSARLSASSKTSSHKRSSNNSPLNNHLSFQPAPPRAGPFYFLGKEQDRSLVGGVLSARRLNLQITGARCACDGCSPVQDRLLAVAELNGSRAL